MSWGMNMSHKIRTEASIPIGVYIFDINLVNHHGWAGDNKYDENKLEIVKRQVFTSSNGDTWQDPNSECESYCIKQIKEGYWDKLKPNPDEPCYYNNNHHYNIIGKDLELYKEAIEKFEALKVFI